MELLSCDCKQKCEVDKSTCIDMGMQCTDLCQLQERNNPENDYEKDNDNKQKSDD